MTTKDIEKHIKKFKNECRKAEKANKRTIKFKLERKCTGKTAYILPKLTGKVGKYKDGYTEITADVKQIRRAISHWETILKNEGNK